MVLLEPDDLPREILLARRLAGVLGGLLLAAILLERLGPESPWTGSDWLVLLGGLPAFVLGYLLAAAGLEGLWVRAQESLETEQRSALGGIARAMVRVLIPILSGGTHGGTFFAEDDHEDAPAFEPRLRPYEGKADRRRLLRLLSRSWRMGVAWQHLHPGDLSWRLRLQPGRDPRADLAVLEAHPGGPAIGFAWLDGDDQGDLWVRPVRERTRLEHELLTWLEERATERGAERLTVGACDGDDRRHALLEARGYAPVEDGLVQLVRPLAHPDAELEPDLPEGYRLAPVTPADFPGVATTIAAAFGTPVKELATYEGLFADPFLREDLVLAVHGPTEEPAACVFAWYDPASHTGHVEPLAVHPDHQRRGLARALLVEALARLQRRGARSAGLLVLMGNAGARALYDQLGFGLRCVDRDWTKPLRPRPSPPPDSP